MSTTDLAFDLPVDLAAPLTCEAMLAELRARYVRGGGPVYDALPAEERRAVLYELVRIEVLDRLGELAGAGRGTLHLRPSVRDAQRGIVFSPEPVPEEPAAEPMDPPVDATPELEPEAAPAPPEPDGETLAEAGSLGGELAIDIEGEPS